MRRTALAAAFLLTSAAAAAPLPAEARYTAAEEAKVWAERQNYRTWEIRPMTADDRPRHYGRERRLGEPDAYWRCILTVYYPSGHCDRYIGSGDTKDAAARRALDNFDVGIWAPWE